MGKWHGRARRLGLLFMLRHRSGGGGWAKGALWLFAAGGIGAGEWACCVM